VCVQNIFNFVHDYKSNLPPTFQVMNWEKFSSHIHVIYVPFKCDFKIDSCLCTTLLGSKVIPFAMMSNIFDVVGFVSIEVYIHTKTH
jgi:hypothetical protein